MAVHKVIRSKPPAQPQSQQPEPGRPRPDRQRKAEIFEVLRRLNRGYGVALDALDKLENKAHRIFPTGFLHGYRSRAELLRAETNRDLLRVLAGHEDQEAARFEGAEEKSHEEKRDEDKPSPKPRHRFK
jgi:hypothetical protein